LASRSSLSSLLVQGQAMEQLASPVQGQAQEKLPELRRWPEQS
jgi:hypothetical protein